MACPKCGSDSPAEVVVEKRYDGQYDPKTRTTTIDWSTVTTDVIIVCPDCGDDYPSTCIANPQ